jgi:hypothetical protein
MTYLFDENWFTKHQSKLLWLLNTPLIKIWFRWVMRIRKFDCPLKKRIDGIAPNNFTFNQKLVLIDHIKLKKGWVIYDPTNRQHKRLRNSCPIEKRIALERTTDFRTHNKYSKRLFYAFYPIWWLAHQWDTLFANQWKPAWNLGFDTLTVYPDPHTESASVDGWVRQNYADGAAPDWATIRAAAGVDADDDVTSGNIVEFQHNSTGVNWVNLTRSIFLFDTSSLTAGATISATVMSIASLQRANAAAATNPDINIYSSNPASNTALAAGDFDSLGTTKFCDTAITYANWTPVDTYHDWTFNAAGRAAISKTSITKLGAKDYTSDAGGVDPGNGAPYSESYLIGYLADSTGTTHDPRLVVTYSLGGATLNPTLLLMGVG